MEAFLPLILGALSKQSPKHWRKGGGGWETLQVIEESHSGIYPDLCIWTLHESAPYIVLVQNTCPIKHPDPSSVVSQLTPKLSLQKSFYPVLLDDIAHGKPVGLMDIINLLLYFCERVDFLAPNKII